jgi:hypothetical protein
LRAKKVEKLVTRRKTVSTNDGLPEISKMKYRILGPGTTISGFALWLVCTVHCNILGVLVEPQDNAFFFP